MPTSAHIHLIRQHLPAVTAHIFLNSGSFGPIPDCVVQAMHERMLTEYQQGRVGKEAFDDIADISSLARGHVARLLNADTNEITLTDNTGEGMNIVYYGISWQPGDEVITTNHEHISGLAPLYQLFERQGVTTCVANLGEQADAPLVARIEELITPRTRLISLSHVTWSTGTVLDIQAVARLGRECGIPVLIDGAQSIGNIPVDVKALDVDFYAIPMQKWLCGPDGTGALYIRSASQNLLVPTYVGYNSANHETVNDWELFNNAQRFELGGRQTAAILGQCAVLRWLEETVGHQWLFQRIAQLNSYAFHNLQKIPGITILTPQPGVNGILAFKVDGHDDLAIVQYLQHTHNIYIRNIPDNHALRISTGFFNTEEEIDSLINAIKTLA
ncbi:cysteine lyase [Ktedonobacteria bacterium brp13]|nr:cysteine lyase [Ktedonobacteria bacterium brp13]